MSKFEHGFTFASFKTPGDQFTAAGEIVCYYIDNSPDNFVTHWHNLQDGAFYHGHYFNNLKDAMNDFQARVLRQMRSYGTQYETAAEWKWL